LLDERVFGDALLGAGGVGERHLRCFDAEGDICARGFPGEGFDLGQVAVEGCRNVCGDEDGERRAVEGDGGGGVEECAESAVGRGEGEEARPEFFEGCRWGGGDGWQRGRGRWWIADPSPALLPRGKERRRGWLAR